MFKELSWIKWSLVIKVTRFRTNLQDSKVFRMISVPRLFFCFKKKMSFKISKSVWLQLGTDNAIDLHKNWEWFITSIHTFASKVWKCNSRILTFWQRKLGFRVKRQETLWAAKALPVCIYQSAPAGWTQNTKRWAVTPYSWWWGFHLTGRWWGCRKHRSPGKTDKSRIKKRTGKF